LGQSHRTIGTDLGVPAGTVRGWIRRVRARAEWLRVQDTIAAHNFDPMLPAIVPAGSLLLANPVSALGTAAAALARRIGLLAPPWQIIAMIACGQFLALAQRLTSTHPTAQPCPQDRDSMTTAATP
jgi:hypothetical protein